MITTLFVLSLLLQGDRILDYKPEGCMVVKDKAEWGIKCPPVKDEKRRAYVLKRKAPKLPGHASELPIVKGPSVKNQEGAVTSYVLPDYPTQCRTARTAFTDHGGMFIGFIRRERNSSAANSLTNEAAYNVEQLVRKYIDVIDREAIAKFRYSKRGGNGDALCTVHFDVGKAELIRIGQIIIDELNKGNRDLAGTGLNPYAHETNK